MSEGRARPAGVSIGATLVFVVVVAGALFLLYGKKQEASVDRSVSGQEQRAAYQTRLMVGVATPDRGSDRLFEVDMEAKTAVERQVANGWRTNQLVKTSDIKIEPRGADGFRVIGDEGWNVTLRDAKGKLYDQPRLLGLFNPSQAAVVAWNGEWDVLRVTSNGDVSKLAVLPDGAQALTAQGGYAWYVTLTPGEGLESEPTGPSTLVRLDVQGTSQVMASSSNVIAGVLPGPDGSYVVRLEDEKGTNEIHFSDGSTGWDEGIPLSWVDGLLVLARGSKLYLTGPLRSLTDLADLASLAGPSAIPSTAALIRLPPAVLQ